MAEFELQGLDGVLSRFETWGHRVIAATDEAIVEAAAEGADLVQSNAPVLTGALRASVTHDHLRWGLALFRRVGTRKGHKPTACLAQVDLVRRSTWLDRIYI